MTSKSTTHGVRPGLPGDAEIWSVFEERIAAPARMVGRDLSVAAVTDPPPELQARRSPAGTWWLAANHEVDPVLVANGGVTYAPERVVTELRTLGAAGVEFDLVYVLHELPGDWNPGNPPPAMRPARGASGAEIVAAQRATFGVGRRLAVATIRALGSATRATAQGVGAVAAVVAYDPVVLGGIRDPGSGKVAWALLARWDDVPHV